MIFLCNSVNAAREIVGVIAFEDVIQALIHCELDKTDRISKYICKLIIFHHNLIINIASQVKIKLKKKQASNWKISFYGPRDSNPLER